MVRKLQAAGAEWMFDAGQAAQGLPRAKASAHVRLPAWVWSRLQSDARPQTQALLSELMQKCLFFLIFCLFFLCPFSC